MQVYSEEALIIPPPMEYLEDVLSAYRQKVEDGVNTLIDVMFTSGYKLFMFETDESSSLFSPDKVSRLATLNNLDRIAPTGALLFAAWPNIEGATGLPVRALAITPRKK